MIRVSVVVLMLACLSVSAQTTKHSGAAVYRASVLDIEFVNNMVSVTRDGGQLHQAIGEVEFRLAFRPHSASFYIGEGHKLSRWQLSVIERFTGVHSEKIWWQDSSSAYHFIPKSPPFLLADYIIQHVFDQSETHTGWEVSGERMEIGGYACYKATRTNIRRNPRTGKETSFPVIAWFCPELPLSYGPTQYGGLPGLILSLQDEKVFYSLDRIEFTEEIFIF